MKKTNRDVEKKEDGEGLGWGGAKKERKSRRRIVKVYKLLASALCTKPLLEICPFKL